MNRRNGLLFVGLAAVWGTAFVATKAALASFPPVVLAAFRFDVAAAALFAVVAATGRRWRPRGRGDWAPVIAGGAFNIGAHHALLFAGQQYVASAVAATLLGLVPVLTPAVARVLRPDERLSPTAAAGIVAGFVGVALIANPDPADLSANVGVGLVLASAVAWVLGAVLTREDGAALPPISLQAWTLLVGAALLHLAALALSGESIAAVEATPAALAWLAYLALVPGAVGFFAYFRLLDRVGPIQAGLIEYAIPPFAALFGWLVLGETLTPGAVFGFLAILAAFLLVKADAVRSVVRARSGVDERG
ncbi:DMT family transporter [Halegenticoccus soli]|uniref:DMT family transporter n=1 Tax=Halegenticoccus soli TaxID=1985678 RepID=UPI000C6DDB9B|nr:DMT family transporter [Halegenticoccus soli]